MTDPAVKQATVIGISSVSGGGKTAVVRRLTKRLCDSVAIHFDDYDDTNRHPDDLQRWFSRGANYDEYDCSVFSRHLQTLKSGRSIRYPANGRTIRPASFVVADAPLGRAHTDSGRFIDLMVFIDTPLDVAMARRIKRGIEQSIGSTANESLEIAKREVSEYEAQAKPIYEHFRDRMRADADLIVNGTLGIDLIVESIVSEIETRLSR